MPKWDAASSHQWLHQWDRADRLAPVFMYWSLSSNYSSVKQTTIFFVLNEEYLRFGLNCTGFPVRGSSRHFWRCGSRHQGNFKYVRNFFFFFFFPCSWKTRWWNFRHLSSTYIKISPYIFIWQMPLPDFHIWKVGLCCTSWQECYKDKYAKQ